MARISGYENIPVKYPASQAGENGNIHCREKMINSMKSELVRIGFNEVINYSFINFSLMHKVAGKNVSAVKLQNPLSEEQSVMRTSLIQGILSTVSLNVKRYMPDLKIFEIGRIYLPLKGKTLPDERVCLTAAISGRANSVSWYEKERNVDFFDMKGVLESLADSSSLELHLKPLSDKKEFLDSSQSADVFLNGIKCGFAGKISNILIDDFELKETVYVFEIDIDLIDFKKSSAVSYSQLSKIPPAYRDLAIIVDEAFTSDEILGSIRKSAGEVLEDVVLFDVYRGKPVSPGKKSVALSLTFRGRESTLTDEEINAVTDKILASLKKEVSAEIRSR